MTNAHWGRVGHAVGPALGPVQQIPTTNPPLQPALDSAWLTLPVLGSTGFALGIVARAAGLVWWLPVSLSFVLLLGLLVFRQRFEARSLRLLCAALLLFPLGWWRLAAVETTPDVFAGHLGQMQLEGFYDGHFLETNQGRLSITPRDALSEGFWRVSGELQNLRQYRNFGSFDLQAWLERRGVHHALHLRDAQPGLPQNGWLGQLQSWRLGLRRHLKLGSSNHLQPTPAALMQALTLGDTDAFSQLSELPDGSSWRDVFAHAGLLHVLALSGQQVTILIAALSVLLAPLGLRRFGWLFGLMLVYWWLVGSNPSVNRAMVQGLAVLLSLWLGRGRLEPLPALGLATLASLIFGPRWLFDLGWQLSTLAVLGMVVFIPATSRLLEHRPAWLRWLGAGLGATLGAQALTLPLTASGFGLIPLFSPLVNLLVEPIMAFLVPLGFLAATLGPLAWVINWLVQPLADLVLGAAQLFASSPMILHWGMIGPAGMVAYFVGMLGVALALHGHLRWSRAWALLFLGTITTTALAARAQAEIVYLDVGQGDSSLIRLPRMGLAAGWSFGMDEVLVDGGGTVRSDYDLGKNVLLPALHQLGVKRLRAVVATHADTDHIEGLLEVLEQVPVGVLIVGHNKIMGSDPLWDKLINAAHAKHVPVQSVRAGQVWTLGDAQFHFLGPRAAPTDEDNPNSVVFALEYHKRRALFLGDLPGELEQGLHPGHLDVLKLAHHGSRFSTTPELLDRTRPRIAIISSGLTNTYGHPAPRVLEALQARRIATYRTDREGAIRFNLETGLLDVVARNPSMGDVGEPGKRPNWKKR